MSEETITAPGAPERDAALESAIRERVGEDRLTVLEATCRGRGSSLDDELALACIAASRREMTDAQRAVFGAVRLVQRAGLRPTTGDRDAWREATVAEPKPKRTKK